MTAFDFEPENDAPLDRESRQTEKLSPRAAMPMYDRAVDGDIPWLIGLMMENGEQFTIEVDESFTLGRRGLDTFEELHLDLSTHNAQKHGVSRVHARVTVHKNGLALHDLGSTNGTFLNGYQIASFTNVPLQDGDLIELGNLPVRVNYLARVK